MAKQRFVSIGITRLDLSEGDWIEVKDELMYGEQLTLENASFVGRELTTDGVRIVQDMPRYHLKRMELYITDWSLRDRQDKPVPISADSLRMLDVATANEINAAIDGHLLKQFEQREPNGVVEEPVPAKNGRSASKTGA